MAHRSAQSSILDSLMGPERDHDFDAQQRNKMNFNDFQVCKHFLCGFCPNQLFYNTKSDIGPCDKIHDEALQQDYTQSDKYQCLGYELEFATILRKIIRSIDLLIRKRQDKLMQISNLDSSSAITAPLLEKIACFQEQIDSKSAEAERLGSEGQMEEACRLMDEITAIEDEKKQQENVIINLQAESEKEQRVCEICGAYLVLGDPQHRLDEHLKGKLHSGAYTLREYLKNYDKIESMLKDKYNVYMNKMSRGESDREYDRRRSSSSRGSRRESSRGRYHSHRSSRGRGDNHASSSRGTGRHHDRDYHHRSNHRSPSSHRRDNEQKQSDRKRRHRDDSPTTSSTRHPNSTNRNHGAASKRREDSVEAGELRHSSESENHHTHSRSRHSSNAGGRNTRDYRETRRRDRGDMDESQRGSRRHHHHHQKESVNSSRSKTSANNDDGIITADSKNPDSHHTRPQRNERQERTSEMDQRHTRDCDQNRTNVLDENQENIDSIAAKKAKNSSSSGDMSKYAINIEESDDDNEINADPNNVYSSYNLKLRSRKALSGNLKTHQNASIDLDQPESCENREDREQMHTKEQHQIDKKYPKSAKLSDIKGQNDQATVPTSNTINMMDDWW